MSDDAALMDVPAPESNGEAAATPKKRKPGPKGKAAPKVNPKAKDAPPRVQAKVPAPKPAKPPKITQAARKAIDRGIQDASRLLKQAADPTRLRVLIALADAGDDGIHVGGLADVTGTASQPAMSHHISLLRNSNIIYQIRDGKRNICRLTDDGLRLVRAVRTLAERE